MKKESKRTFITTCFYLAASLVASAFASLLTLTGCNKKQKTSPSPDDSESEKSELIIVQKSGKNPSDFEPAYMKLHRSGELKKRGEERPV